MTERNKERTDSPLPFRFFNKDGMPLKVLSTSLGIALIANAAYGAAPSGKVFAEPAASPSPSSAPAGAPALVEWSTEEVKAYYDAYLDWNIPVLQEEEEQDDASGGGSVVGTGGSAGGAGGGGTTVVHSGFGWDDLLLYHLIFNRGSAYSSSTWHNANTAYDARTGKVYKPTAYGPDTFQNKPVTGSSVRPKTSNTTGSITRRSTSSSPGGIGGTSSGLSSSSSSSNSVKSSSSGGFFGG